MLKSRPVPVLFCLVCLLLFGCGGGTEIEVTLNAGDMTSVEISARVPEDPMAEKDNTLSGSPPPARGGAPAVWIGSEKRAVLFGGMSPITGDTWELDVNRRRWTELTDTLSESPLPRCHHTFISDLSNANMLLFGGFSRQQRFNDLWRYDLGTRQWQEIDDRGNIPSPRCLHVGAFIESTQEMLVFGGIQGSGTRSSEFFDDTYLYNSISGQWRQLDVQGPGKRSGSIAFYSSSQDAVYLWGGKNVDTLPNSLWRFDVVNEQWTEVATSGDKPLGREDPIHFWNDAEGTLFMASGADTRSGINLFSDALSLDLSSGAWQRLEFDKTPEARWRATLSYDAIENKGYLFGGWQDFGAMRR